MDWFVSLPPAQQALVAGLFTWFITALGAAGVFVFATGNRKLFSALLGFAGGVMIAASFWSLLAPSIALSEELGQIKWLAPAVGFLLGGVFLRVLDKLLPHLHQFSKLSKAEGLPSKWHKTILMFSAVTLHNIPEGLAIGVAFGALSQDISGATLAGAIALTLGIGIQNFPEGFAVSIPFRREGLSRTKSFLFGQASALVEPIAAVLGALLVVAVQPILPYALAFAAGAMIFVTLEQIMPEAQSDGGGDIATAGAMIGFTIMMILDVAFG